MLCFLAEVQGASGGQCDLIWLEEDLLAACPHHGNLHLLRADWVSSKCSVIEQTSILPPAAFQGAALSPSRRYLAVACRQLHAFTFIFLQNEVRS